MTAVPPGSGAPPPPPPPGPRGGNRNLTVAIAGVAVVAAAVILAIVLISNSGGKSTSGAAATPRATSGSPSSPPLTASGIPPRSSSSASSSAASSSSTAAGAFDCAAVSAAPAVKPIASFTKGGALPSGVPVPQAVPALTCTGTSTSGGHQVTLVAVGWTAVPLAQYDAQLRGSGWKEQSSGPLHVYRRSGAPKAIVLTEIDGRLVAIYGPPK
jgi:hypothetical protein